MTVGWWPPPTAPGEPGIITKNELLMFVKLTDGEILNDIQAIQLSAKMKIRMGCIRFSNGLLCTATSTCFGHLLAGPFFPFFSLLFSPAFMTKFHLVVASGIRLSPWSNIASFLYMALAIPTHAPVTPRHAARMGCCWVRMLLGACNADWCLHATRPL